MPIWTYFNYGMTGIVKQGIVVKYVAIGNCRVATALGSRNIVYCGTLVLILMCWVACFGACNCMGFSKQANISGYYSISTLHCAICGLFLLKVQYTLVMCNHFSLTFYLIAMELGLTPDFLRVVGIFPSFEHHCPSCAEFLASWGETNKRHQHIAFTLSSDLQLVSCFRSCKEAALRNDLSLGYLFCRYHWPTTGWSFIVGYGWKHTLCRKLLSNPHFHYWRHQWEYLTAVHEMGLIKCQLRHL